MNSLKLTLTVISFICINPFSFSQVTDGPQTIGYKEVQLTKDKFDNRYSSYNKSGDRIVFESNRDGHWQIYTMDIDGNDQKRIINSSSTDRRPSWHPTKPIILFESNRTGTYELYTLDLTTDEITKVPMDVKGNKHFAQFAPNGSQIVFSLKESSKDSDIFITYFKRQKTKKYIDNKFTNLYAHYSPKGDNIAFFSNKNVQGETDIIYVFNIITKSRSRLSYFVDQSSHPIWSNKRGEIAYVASIKGDDNEIYIMKIDGTHKHQITFNNTEDTLPNWSPNDENLLITRYKNGNYHLYKILLKEPLLPAEGSKN